MSEVLRQESERRARVFNNAVKAAVSKVQRELETERDELQVGLGQGQVQAGGGGGQEAWAGDGAGSEGGGGQRARVISTCRGVASMHG